MGILRPGDPGFGKYGVKNPKKRQTIINQEAQTYVETGSTLGTVPGTSYPSPGSSSPVTAAPEQTAMQALQNIRQQYEKPGEKKTKGERELEQMARSSTAQIARLGRSMEQDSLGEIARDLNRRSPETVRAQERSIARDTNKKLNKEFDQLVKPIARAETLRRQKGKSPSPAKMEAAVVTPKEVRKALPTVKDRALTLGEASRFAWQDSPLKKDSPWRGVKGEQATVRKTRQMVRDGALLWPDEVQKRRNERKEADRVSSLSPTEALGEAMSQLAEGSGLASAKRNLQAFAESGGNLPALESKQAGGSDSVASWEDSVNTALLATALMGGSTIGARIGAAKFAAKGRNTDAVKILAAQAKASKTGRAVQRVQAIRASNAYRKGRTVARTGALGAAVAGHEKTLPIIQGTGEAIIENPGDVAKATGRAAISTLTYPFAVGGNAALSLKQKSLLPLETLAKESIDETKRMADIYLSGDKEKIQKFTEEDIGLMGALGAYWLMRPGLKGPIRRSIRKAGEHSDTIQSGIDFFDRRKAASHTKTAVGRANAQAFVAHARATDAVLRRRRKLNSWLHGDTGRAAQRRLDERNKRENEAMGGTEKDPAVRPINIEDLAVFTATKGITPEAIRNAGGIKNLRREIADDAEDHRYIEALNEVPELWDANSTVGKDFWNLSDEIRVAADTLNQDNAWVIGPDGEPQRAGDYDDAIGTEVMATGDALFGRGYVDRPAVALKKFEEGQKEHLKKMQSDTKAKGRARNRTRTQRREAEVKLGEMEITERRRGGTVRRQEKAEGEARTASDRLLDHEVRRREVEDRQKAITTERNEIQKEITAINNGTWEGGYDAGRFDERQLRAKDRGKAKQGRLRSTDKLFDKAYKGRLNRADSKARLRELKKRDRELWREQQKVNRYHQESAAYQEKLRAAERRVREAESKADARLGPLRQKVRKLREQETEQAKALAEAIEYTRAYQAEINDVLTPAEKQRAIARANANQAMPSTRPLDEINNDLADARMDLDEQTALAIDPDATPTAQAAALAAKRHAEARIGQLVNEQRAAELDNAAALNAANIRAALAIEKDAKREARLAPIRKALEKEFQRKLQEYYELGLSEAAYIWHKEPKGKSVESGSPEYNSLLGSPRERLREGTMAREGRADRSFDAFLETVNRSITRTKNENLTHFMVSEAAVKVIDKKGNPQWQFTEKEIAAMPESQTKGKLRLDQRLLSDPSKFGNVIRLDANKLDQNAIESLNRAAAIEDGQIDAEGRLTQKLAQEGDGRKFALIDETTLRRMIEAEEKMGKGMSKAWRWIEALPARLVLGTSPSWLFAQPIAEFLVLLADHPERTFKAIYEHWNMNKRDPEAFASLKMIAGNSLGTDLIQSSRGQAMIAKGIKGYRATIQGQLIKEIATLQSLGKIDRAKSGYIRELGVLAEMDRELSSFRRQSKAIMGQMDGIEKVADTLSRLPTPEERLKWLDSREGQEAGLRIARNIDAALGNWTDLTKFERGLSRVIFFYPFVRFSINWTFRTFPKRHPARYAILTTLGVANAEMVERYFGKPNFANEWAMVPLFGGPNGEVTSAIPLNRYIPGGNAFVEAGMGQGNLLFNVTKALNPLYGIGFRMAAGRDAFGTPIEGEGYGLKAPSEKDLVGTALDEIANLPVPLRELRRVNASLETSGGPIAGFGISTSRDALKPGDDPNGKRDNFRRNVFAGTPIPAHVIRDERRVNELFQKRDTLTDLKNVPYSEAAKKGEAVLKRESDWDKANPSWETMPGRTAAEKRAVIQFIREQGERIANRRELKNTTRELFDFYKDRGLLDSLPDVVREDTIERRQKARAAASDGAPSWIVGKKRLEYATPAELEELAAANGRLLLSLTKPGWDSNKESWEGSAPPKAINFAGARTTARIEPGDDPDTAEQKIANASTTYSPAQVRKLQALPRPRKVKFAKKILKAKHEYMASKGVRVDGPFSDGQKRFLSALAAEIPELDAKGLGAWMLSEQNGDAAQYYDDNGFYNYLNIGVIEAAGDPWTRTDTSADPVWQQSPEDAAKATARFIRGQEFGPSELIKQILPTAKGKDGAAVLDAVNASDWAGAKYGNYDALDEITVKPGREDGNPQLKNKWLRMVARGKAMGVYEVPKEPVKIRTHPGEAGTKGDWAGGELIMERALKGTGIEVSSRKRAADDPLSLENPGSDHNEANTSAYAVDLPATGERGREIAAIMHKKLGLTTPLDQLIGTYDRSESTKYPGYSFQLLWEVDGHYDHVHIGVNTPDANGKLVVGPMSPMQQVKMAMKAKRAAAAASASSSGSSGGGGTSGGGSTGSGALGANAYERLMNMVPSGTSADMTYPSPVESQLKANSVAAGLTNLPEYKKVEVPKARRRRS